MLNISDYSTIGLLNDKTKTNNDVDTRQNAAAQQQYFIDFVNLYIYLIFIWYIPFLIN